MNKVMSLFFGTFILTGAAFAQTQPPAASGPDTSTSAPAIAPAAASTDTTSTVKPVHHHHADIHKAMHKLRGAKDELQKLTNDYGGHRTQAIADIDLALTELKAAIDADAATTK